MSNRLRLFPVLGVIGVAFVAGSGVGQADATNAPAAQTLPSDAPPAPSVPSETPQPAGPSAEGTGATATPSGHPTEYTVVTGDTLWGVSHKFKTSIRELKKLNHLKKDHLKPGQVLKLPAAKSSSRTPKKTAAVPSRKTKLVAFHEARHAQPVQDFDLPASTFASCPVPEAAEETEMPAAGAPGRASVAASVSVPEKTLTYRTPSGPVDLEETAPPAIAEAPTVREVPSPSRRVAQAHANSSRPAAIPPALAFSNPAPAPAPKPASRGLFNFFYTPPPSVDWGAKFTQVARDLGDRGIDYNDDWRPPGDSHSWTMDCSNTTRYLYRAATGIQLPRTASDQYYYLHLQNKAWDVPMTARGFADCNYLRRNLQAGDLLFWENTYKPDRQPPITHVMIFLGNNAQGQWIMAGSQSTRGGEHNRRHGGPDIYVFNPTRPCGGYSTWLGLVHHQGRFCAFGRPLQADKSKLSVAADD